MFKLITTDAIFNNIQYAKLTRYEHIFNDLRNIHLYHFQCGKLLYFYHSGRRTIKLFRISDGKMKANFKLSGAANVIETTQDGKRYVPYAYTVLFIV